MCGIAGIVGATPALREGRVLKAMLRSLSHRGPDDEGSIERGTGAIGARRLAIIDLAHGHQPMTNEDGSIAAVQNGEIYNFIALREQLVSLGHAFATRNDTEVLPHAYEEWGDAFVQRLRGMFALAVWDAKTATLVLARDRFGKKPLVYAQIPDGIAFGSEIQALLTHPQVSRAVDARAIDDYLTYGYVPAPRTAFAQIRKIPPGHVLVWHGDALQVRRYWRLAFTPKLRISLDDAAAEVRIRIEEAVRVRLMSDVPIGAFLSGGLDSSTVVAFMARHSERPVRTFSIGFGDQKYDELAYARIVARAFGTDHHELVVDSADVDVLPMLVRHLGEPHADSSIVPTYHVARITRQQVTVALNGDGGDELFAGYDRYKAAALARLTIERLPRGVASAIAAAAAAVPLGAGVPRTIQRGRRFLAALGLAPEPRFLRWTGYFTGPLHELIAGERLRALGARDPVVLLAAASAVTGATDASERYMASDILMNLPGDLLVKMDIATMANSLEARSPLLDHELAEFVAQLPASYKLSPLRSKILLRRAMKDILPTEILQRSKMGFSAPVGAWLRGPLRSMFADLVLSPTAAARGYVSPEGVRVLFDEHVSGRADRTPWLWCLLMLELWFRECVDAPLTDQLSGSALTLS
jgi:asparagine synthase (glutamine-hydrolysing)